MEWLHRAASSIGWSEGPAGDPQRGSDSRRGRLRV
jgi:hypothetical protein